MLKKFYVVAYKVENNIAVYKRRISTFKEAQKLQLRIPKSLIYTSETQREICKPLTKDAACTARHRVLYKGNTYKNLKELAAAININYSTLRYKIHAKEMSVSYIAA